jgi:3D (Asp-Asp-Asp) domain-containing protein
MPEQNVKQRAKNFEQVTTGYTEEHKQHEGVQFNKVCFEKKGANSVMKVDAVILSIGTSANSPPSLAGRWTCSERNRSARSSETASPGT